MLKSIMEFSCLIHKTLRNAEAETNGTLRNDLQTDLVTHIS